MIEARGIYAGLAASAAGIFGAAAAQVSGTLMTLGEMGSDALAPRPIQVWLPPGYHDSEEEYPVIYMHDGQNLFERGRSYTGDEWQVDETATRLIDEGEIHPVIIVGVGNTEQRWQDYAPQKVVERLPEDLKTSMLAQQGAPLLGDAYLRFLTEELKPVIDAQFRTRANPEDTFLMGSSMGALISLYGAAEYPSVFGGAAGLSMHWPLADPRAPEALDTLPAMQAFLADSELDPERQKLWFDRGTINLDAAYPPYFSTMESWFASHYDGAPTQVRFEVYDGADHNEDAWSARFGDPLRFLIGTGAQDTIRQTGPEGQH